MRDLTLNLYLLLWRALRPLLFLNSPQRAHERAMALLSWMDRSETTISLASRIHRSCFPRLDSPQTEVGGVRFGQPLILAAGMVKGPGFVTEQDALAAVEKGDNLLPGWRSLPALLGPVEFGSFTRWPREGNAGAVLWRDSGTRTTRNRVGLRNPGARAAARFLGLQRDQWPETWGVNIATSPAIDDVGRQGDELLESIGFFLDAGVRPSWFTLNVSCPNTGEDPRGRYSAALVKTLCEPAVRRAHPTPLWIKIAPDLAPEQYKTLPKACVEAGVRAIVATNTLAQPSPANARLDAGLGGEDLFPHARRAQRLLQQELEKTAGAVDLIACGGILDGAGWKACEAKAGQYWSALVWRGPLAAALILREGQNDPCQ
ncbi:MAG: hypothetical protein OXP68_00450 [Anaerolineaceae bacterium]|nr:hypothetical protein [Anaerolineaceae bacterium]MDE0328358.1 hypothetical protein [Anaerolineaceae bacterium]